MRKAFILIGQDEENRSFSLSLSFRPEEEVRPWEANNRRRNACVRMTIHSREDEKSRLNRIPLHSSTELHLSLFVCMMLITVPRSVKLYRLFSSTIFNKLFLTTK